jgi:hypothetical protein
MSPLSPENQDRAKKALLIIVPVALGSAALNGKIPYKKNKELFISYYEASKSAYFDFLDRSKKTAKRIGTVLQHGPDGLLDVRGLEMDSEINISESDVRDLEEIATKHAQSQDNPLQTP